MAKLSPRTVPYRRAREQKTNYKKRLHLLLSGKPRLVVRLTNRRAIGQIVSFETQGDRVVAATDSFSLRKFGWKSSTASIPSAYLTGLLLGKKAAAKGYKEAVVDTGFRRPAKKGRMYALVKGALDAGMDIPHDQDIFPPEERLQGKHLKSVPRDEFSAVQHAITARTNQK